MSDVIETVAAMLREAAERGIPIAPVAPLLPVGDLDAAYAVQEVNTGIALAAGRRLVGRKIGLTSAAVQNMLGVHQPDYGMLFADMGYDDRADIPLDAVLQPRIEAEVALVLGADLDNERNSVADVIAATAFALPCLEIVGSRIADWKIGIVDTIADNASSGAFVLGATPRPLSALDLRMCGMVLEKNGEPVSTGVGQACLGNPLNAARWLADVMARAGRPLRAGDVILSGALGPMVPVVRGDLIGVRINGLGSVAARFV
ncbi:MAG: fumarylacetoacetate hydrolase family protein [Candidatus Sphingomonas colombiensis]|nr:fumarylacetoacetate hydrolase family protein [Sphingomonas sp.]WEK43163.1 MAG: fumarylacetoacetate hydrolase family protein [Sphingomonas sp.]